MSSRSAVIHIMDAPLRSVEKGAGQIRQNSSDLRIPCRLMSNYGVKSMMWVTWSLK
jgi:hypothetical protein